MRYQKKPVIVEAYQTDKEMDIQTLEGTMHASVGDFIITGVNGEQYPCKPDIFAKTYDICDAASRWRSGADNPRIAELIHEYRENHKTNADRIRQMTDEELARLIAGDWCELINCPDLVCEGQCAERILAWLKKEADPTPQNEEKHEIGEQGTGPVEEGGRGRWLN